MPAVNQQGIKIMKEWQSSQETRKINLDLTAQEISMLREVLSSAKREQVDFVQGFNAPDSQVREPDLSVHTNARNQKISLIEKVERVLQ